MAFLYVRVVKKKSGKRPLRNSATVNKNEVNKKLNIKRK